jgi:phosphoenolpyruvate carboxylase
VESPEVREEIFGRIRAEHALSVERVLAVSGQQTLLQKTPVLMESIRLRNPYVDTLNALQVEYLKLWRRGKLSRRSADRVLLVLLLTVNGVAFGMKSTG